MARFVLSVASFLFLASGLAHAGGGGKLAFSTDIEGKMREAKMKGKPFIMYFTASW